jgi:hypothetical protein
MVFPPFPSFHPSSLFIPYLIPFIYEDYNAPQEVIQRPDLGDLWRLTPETAK